MIIKPEKMDVYNWNDIVKELCHIMNIPEDKFRDYHEIVGGQYKDFWHVCLENIIPESMSNRTIVTMYAWEGDEFTGEEEWKNVVLNAWNQFYDEADEEKTDSGILVDFWW